MRVTSPIRIIFLTPSLDTPSTRYRISPIFPELEREQFQITLQQIPKNMLARWRLFHQLPHFDMVFLQKKLFQSLTLWYLRRKAKCLVYDFDDAVIYRDSNAAKFQSASRFRGFKMTTTLADLVISGNDYLKSLALPFNKHVAVIPTGIETNVHVPRTTFGDSQSVTIGWVGSKPNLIYLKQLIGPINRLFAANPRFKFKIVCNDFIDGFDCPVEKKTWSAEDAVQDFQSLDIGVMPLADDLWTRGKCAFKLLQYMSCGIASVSSSTDVTTGIIEHGKNGFLAKGDNQWIDALSLLIEDADKREDMGRNARASIMGCFDMTTIGKAYAKALRQAYMGNNLRQ